MDRVFGGAVSDPGVPCFPGARGRKVELPADGGETAGGRIPRARVDVHDTGRTAGRAVALVELPAQPAPVIAGPGRWLAWSLGAAATLLLSLTAVYQMLETPPTASGPAIAEVEPVTKQLLASQFELETTDDLGAGYSNLRYIAELNPRLVKLDRALVSGVRPGSRMHRLVAGLVVLCESLDAQVVAEGIETVAELRAVREAGVHYGQGYLFARPDYPAAAPYWPLSDVAGDRATASSSPTPSPASHVRTKQPQSSASAPEAGTLPSARRDCA